MYEEKEKKTGLTGNMLKIIALISMAIDHVGATILEPAYNIKFSNIIKHPFTSDLTAFLDLILRSIGRLSFPIFCFLLVEGYFHTKNLKVYLIRLTSFALISEIPFDMAFKCKVFDLKHQNVFFTLVLGLVAIALWDFIVKRPYPDPLESFRTSSPKTKILSFGTVSLIALIAQLAQTNYGAVGVFLIFSFYLFRADKGLKYIICVAILLCASTAEIMGIPALLLMDKYNGKRGRKIQYFFYAFYPLHLLVLVLIRIAVFNIGIKI